MSSDILENSGTNFFSCQICASLNQYEKLETKNDH